MLSRERVVPHQQQAPRARLRRAPWVIAVALGTLLSAVAAGLAWQLEEERALASFTLAAGDRFVAIERRVEAMPAALGFLSGLLAYEETGAQEFDAVARPVMDRLPAVRQIGWAPVRGDRAAASAPNSTEHLPSLIVSYSTARAEAFPGSTDLAGLPALEPCIREALALGLLSSRSLLLKDNGRPLIVFIQPVYGSGADRNADAPLLGVLFGVEDVGVLVREALSALVPRGVDISVSEVGPQGTQTMLYHYASPARAHAAGSPDTRPASARIGNHTLQVGTQTWLLVAADEMPRDPARATLPWVLLTGGLLFSSLLGVYLASLARQRERFTRLVARLEQEVSERRRMQLQLAQLAHHDPLTGLANRVLFADRVEQALAHAARSGECVALLYLDLDGFKDINDTLGHEQGDFALQILAQRLQGAVRAEDTVARLGGDEFTILYRDIKAAEEALRLAAKVLALMEQPVVLQGRPRSLSASIGISLYPDTARDVEALLQQADLAMYAVKKSGKRGYRFYTPERDPDRDGGSAA